MRFVKRPSLEVGVLEYLEKRQGDADKKNVAGKLIPDNHWNSSQKTAKIRAVRQVLGKMAGSSEGCMYCSDSHGSDIEHFWPKTSFPARMYSWPNLLLSCTPCGRFKLAHFPRDNNGDPLLIDPSVDDPWAHLDYDVNLGILTARFNRELGKPSEKGRETVELLHLDKRERIENQYKKNWKRLVKVAKTHLQSELIDLEGLMKELHESDDHGLLGWCIGDNGVREVPFDALWKAAPDVLSQLRESHFNVKP